MPINRYDITSSYYKDPTQVGSWAGGRQRPLVTPEESRASSLKYGAIGAGIFASGFIPLSANRKLWDTYISGVRVAENLFPGRIATTFRLSEILSPLESVAPKDVVWQPKFWHKKKYDLVSKPDGGFRKKFTGFALEPNKREYLSKLLGAETLKAHEQDILKSGIELRKGKLYIAGTNKVVLERATKMRAKGLLGPAKLFEQYARGIGVNIPGEQRVYGFKSRHSYMPIGGRNISQSYRRFAGGVWTSLSERFLDVLPTELIEAPGIQKVAGRFKATGAYKKIRTIISPIKRGTGTQTLSRLLVKRLLPAYAAYKVAERIDYETDHFFSKGILETYSNARVFKAKLMEVSGLQRYAEKQEEIAPKSTSLLALMGVPLGGALLGMAAYPARIASTAVIARKYAKKGAEFPWLKATRIAAKHYEKEKYTVFGIKSILGKALKKRTLSGALRWSGGLVGAALMLPFLPGALIGTEKSEELAAIYGGRKEVGIRKGRAWELGRCLMKSTTCKLYNKETKEAQEVKVGDILVGRSHKRSKVIEVYTRQANELMYSFSSAFDRDVKTDLTGNHIVPVLRKGKLIEEEAKNIKYGDFVEVPFEKLNNTTSTIKTKDFIRFSFIEQDGQIYSAQKNWHTGNDQKSGKYSVKNKVALNEEIGRLFGYFLAEGNLSFRNAEIPQFIETVHAVSEKWIVDDIIKICEKYFDVTPTFKHRKDFEKAKEGAYIVRICSSILAKLFYGLFYNNNRSSDKAIPEIFLSATDDFKKGLIEGYWRGDGHLDKFAMVISSSRKHLLEDVQLMALNLGMLCGIGPKEENGFKGKWRLRFYTKDNLPNRSMQIYDGRLFAVIRKVETYLYEDIVYDFEVETKEHLFVAGTFLVHNSPYEGGRTQYFRQHFIPQFLSRARDEALYGSEKRKHELDPFWHPIDYLKDPYRWEREHYKEFPFPITGLPFEDVPIVGPLLAGTVGRMIKPTMLMHQEEWLRPTTQGPVGSGGRFAEAAMMAASHGQDGGMVRRLPAAFGTEPAYGLGEIPLGSPVSPYTPTQLFGEQIYRMTELYGLSGYMSTVLKGTVTGTEEFYDQMERLESSTRATGIERQYWDVQLGGGMFSTEQFRRLFPHRRRQIDMYNPIRNTMPEWLPGPGERAPDFQYGFAYGKIKEGEVRLPGRGYEALHPALEGLDPEEYPLIHKYKILSDVAPYSSRTKKFRNELRKLNKTGQLSAEERAMFSEINDQFRQKKEFRKFYEHKFIKQDTITRQFTISEIVGPGQFTTEEDPGVVYSMAGVNISGAALGRLDTDRETVNEMLAQSGFVTGGKIQLMIANDALHKYSKETSDRPEIRGVAYIGDENLNRMLLDEQMAEYQESTVGPFAAHVKYSKYQRAVGSYWEWINNLFDTPFEKLTPLSPWNKMMHMRSAVEDYAATQVYGTENAFWDRPWENFLRPAIDRFKHKYLGMTEIPSQIQDRNAIEEYFDKLEYVKYTKLMRNALSDGDFEAAEEYEKLRERTAFGANPYKNPLNALLALQKRDKPYFDAFVNVKTEEEREQIMEMMPEYEQHLIQARWDMKRLRQLYAERKARGSLSEEQWDLINELNAEREAEGQEITEEAREAYADYVEDVGRDAVSYAAFQREQELEEYFEEHPLPKRDWVGWHPHTDLEDVKLKVVQNEGCISGDSCLLTDDLDEIEASSVLNDNQVLNSDGDICKVQEVFRYVNTNNLYEISNSGIALGKLTITGNHIVPVLRQSTYRYKMIEVPVSEIRKQDKMLYPKMKLKESFRKTDLIEYAGRNKDDIWYISDSFFKYRSNSHIYTRHVDLDGDFGKFLGWYIAEGNILYRNGAPKGIQFSLSGNEDKEANWLIDYAHKKFGVKGVIKKSKVAHSISVYIYGVPIANLILSLCDGRNAIEKKLTNEFFNLSISAILNAMLSWHHGDGWVSKRDNGGKAERLYISTSSRKLAKQGWYILNSLGIRTRMQVVKARETIIRGKKVNTKQSYRLGIGDKVAKKAFLLSRPTNQADYYCKIKLDSSCENYFWFGIKKLYVGNKNIPVYDFDVGEPHHYVTICGIVHNSDMHDFNLWESREKSLPYKPYLDEEAIAQVEAIDSRMTSADIRAILAELLGEYDMENIDISISQVPSTSPVNMIDLDVERDVFNRDFSNYASRGLI